jgi:hypothetical protein
MTRIIIQQGKKRRTPLLLFALLAVISGVLIGGGSFSSAAPSTDASVVEYSQCAQGAPGTPVPPADPGPDAGTCVQGWINGILQGSNSQYSEDQVTAQRLVVSVPKGGLGTGRTITLKYLWNKSSNHAYDSLARWNTTINWLTASGVCAGVPGPASACPANDGTYASTNGLGTSLGNGNAQVPSSPCSDGTILGGVDHQLSDRTLAMFGGTITNISTPTNDSSACSTTADEYETVTITYSTDTSSSHNVMLLFGGHLAAGGGPRSWGAGKGSSAINGGPYHIKLTQLDTSSVGNRDNQISSGAILPLATGVTTQLHQTDSTGADVSPANNESGTAGLTVNMPSGGGGVYVTDFATVTPTGATGTVDFRYYTGSTAAADCAAATNSSEGGTSAGLGKPLNSSGVAQSNTINFTSIGTVYWRAFFQGSDISTSSSSGCSDEILTVHQNTSTSTTLHQTNSTGTDVSPANNNDPITVPINSYVVDYASVTPSSATGSVTFKLYTTSAACTADTTGAGGTSEGGTASSTAGTWTSNVYHATTAGDFYWRAVFSGTGGNNGSVSGCEHLIVQKGSPTVASAPWLVPQDKATIAGILSGGTTQATVTFDLYPPSNATCSSSGTAAVYHQVVNVNGDGTYPTTNSGDSAVNNGFRLTSASASGVYHWHVVYSGDEANNSNDRGCVEAFNFQGITDQAAG